MNIVEELKQLRGKIIKCRKNTNTTVNNAIYISDDFAHIKEIETKNRSICVQYHSVPGPIPAILLFALNGQLYGKWNPEYVNHLKKENPEITEKEISEIMGKAYLQRTEQWQKEIAELEEDTVTVKSKQKIYKK